MYMHTSGNFILDEYSSSHEHGGSGNFCEKITLKKQQKFGVWIWLLALKAHLSYASESHSKRLTWIKVPGKTTLFVDILGSCWHTLKKQRKQNKKPRCNVSFELTTMYSSASATLQA